MLGFDSFFLNFVFPIFFGFEMEKTKNKVLFVFFEWLWSIKVAKKQKKPPRDNKKSLVKNKHSLKSFAFWFCSSSLFFLFVYWFTWLPSVSPGKSNFDQSFSPKNLSTMWD